MSASPHDALRLPGLLDGVDVSSVQSTVDYAAVAAAGFRFAVVKSAEGVSGFDGCALKHLNGFRAAGMHAIPYLFLHPSLGAPDLQVSNLVRHLGGEWPGRVCLDFETRQTPETNEELVRFLELAVEECMAWGALAPAIYTYPDFARRLQPELGKSKTLGGCPLWMATYVHAMPSMPHVGEAPYVPLPWFSWTLWQYSGNGGYRVPGVFGDCDRDLFNGDEAHFREWLGLPEAPATPPPPTDPGFRLESYDALPDTLPEPPEPDEKS